MDALTNALEALDHHLDAVRNDPTWSLHGRLGSALLWVCALDEAFWTQADYEQRRDSDGDGAVIPGLRRARDAVTHRLVQPSAEGGLEYPLGATLSYPDVWVPLASLGPSTSRRAPQQDRSYVAEVQGRRVLEPLLRARRWLARAVG